MLLIKKSVLIYSSVISYLYLLFFSGWILKFTGLPDNFLLVLIKIIDFIPIIFWVIMNPSFLIHDKQKSIISLSYWLLWCLILLLLIFTSKIHGNQSISLSLVQVGALIRYIPLANIIIYCQKYNDYWMNFVHHLKIILFILISIFILVLLGGEQVMMFFLPVMGKNATGLRESLLGNYSLVFANTIDLSFLLLILYTILVHNKSLSFIKRLIFTLIMFLPILRTGSLITFAVFLFISFVNLTYNKIKIRTIISILLIITISVIAYHFRDEIEKIIEIAKLSRLGMIFQTLPDFIREMSFDTFFGVGCDGNIVLNKVNSYPNPVHMLVNAKSGDISMFGDVYWVALTVFHGIIGTCLIIYTYYIVYKAVLHNEYIDSTFLYKKIIYCLFFEIIILGFLNQVLVVKTFCVIFWILIGFIYSKTYKNESPSNK